MFGLVTGVAMGGGARNGWRLFGISGALVEWIIAVPTMDGTAQKLKKNAGDRK